MALFRHPQLGGIWENSLLSTNCIQLPKQRLLVIFVVLKNLIPQIQCPHQQHMVTLCFICQDGNCFRYRTFQTILS